MSSAIGSSTSTADIPPAPIAPQQIKSGGKDRDGNKSVEVEKPEASDLTIIASESFA